MLISATALMGFLLVYGWSPLRGNYTLLYVQVKTFVTGYNTVIFVYAMIQNCKNLATMAYSTGVLLFRSVQNSVIDVKHLLGTDSLTVLQSFQSLLPKCCDDHCPVCKARMLHHWAGIIEALVSM